MLDCGHEPSPHGEHTTGTARTRDGREICYSCADERMREQMRNTNIITAYVSGDGKAITTWSGGKLADVTRTWSRKVGFGRATRHYYRAIDADGRRWYGCSEGPGMIITLRLARGARS